MKAFLVMCFALIMSGCASLSQLSTYTVSNSELEQVLKSQLDSLRSESTVVGIPLSLAVKDMTVNIGPENRDVVQLGTRAIADITVLGFSYSATLNLRLEGTPFYDSQQKAIFIRSLALRESSVEAGGYKGDLAPISDEVMSLVNTYLSSNPVYKMDTTNDAVRLLTSIPLDLTVAQGKLVLQPK